MIPWIPLRVVSVLSHARRPVAGVAVVMAATLLLAPGLARAQEAPAAAPKSGGWWAGGGAGYVAGRLDCTNCVEDPPYGNNTAYVFQGGLRLNDKLQVGGEIFSFGRTIQDLHFRQSFLLGIAQFRPWASQGFFLKGGYGMAFIREVVPDGDDVIRTWGMGLTYGAGWIFDAGPHVSVAPYGAHYVTTVGDVPTPLGTAENVVGNGWFIGATIMFR